MSSLFLSLKNNIYINIIKDQLGLNIKHYGYQFIYFDIPNAGGKAFDEKIKKIIGLLTFSTGGLKQDQCYIDKFYFEDEEIGRKMLNRFLKFAKEYDYKYATFGTSGKEMIKLKLLVRQGFHITSTFKDNKTGEYIHSLSVNLYENEKCNYMKNEDYSDEESDEENNKNSEESNENNEDYSRSDF